ncbi:MAG: Abi family protein, partial [Coriobacteriales bacterium]|nr:Abi family protein [Coriobacteriales bacterium]
MDYTKPSLTFNQQADLLISRGLICNRDELVEKLMDVNYYRLSGYWNPFLRHDGSFKNGTEFSTIWTTYVFDRRFRLIVFDAIERVEV